MTKFIAISLSLLLCCLFLMTLTSGEIKLTKYTSRMIVLNQGTICADDPPIDVLTVD